MPAENVFTLEDFVTESIDFLSSVTELVSVFKQGAAAYIEHTKDIIDARKWALDMEHKLQDIIFRINKFS